MAGAIPGQQTDNAARAQTYYGLPSGYEPAPEGSSSLYVAAANLVRVILGKPQLIKIKSEATNNCSPFFDPAFVPSRAHLTAPTQQPVAGGQHAVQRQQAVGAPPAVAPAQAAAPTFDAQQWLTAQCQEMQKKLSSFSEETVNVEARRQAVGNELYQLGQSVRKAIQDVGDADRLSQHFLGPNANDELRDLFRQNVELIGRFFQDNGHTSSLDQQAARFLFSYLGFLKNATLPNAQLSSAFAELENTYRGYVGNLQSTEPAAEVDALNRQLDGLNIANQGLVNAARDINQADFDNLGDPTIERIGRAATALVPTPAQINTQQPTPALPVTAASNIQSKVVEELPDDQKTAITTALDQNRQGTTTAEIQTACFHIYNNLRDLKQTVETQIQQANIQRDTTASLEQRLEQLDTKMDLVAAQNTLAEVAVNTNNLDNARTSFDALTVLNKEMKTISSAIAVELMSIAATAKIADATTARDNALAANTVSTEYRNNIAELISATTAIKAKELGLPPEFENQLEALAEITANRLRSRTETVLSTTKIKSEVKVVTGTTGNNLTELYKTDEGRRKCQLAIASEIQQNLNNAANIQAAAPPGTVVNLPNLAISYPEWWASNKDIRADEAFGNQPSQVEPLKAFNTGKTLVAIAREIATSGEYSTDTTTNKTEATALQRNLAKQLLGYDATLFAISYGETTPEYHSIREELDAVANLFCLSLVKDDLSGPQTHKLLKILLHPRAPTDLDTLGKVGNPQQMKNESIGLLMVTHGEQFIQPEQTASSLLKASETIKTYRNDVTTFEGQSRQEVFSKAMIKAAGILTPMGNTPLRAGDKRTMEASKKLESLPVLERQEEIRQRLGLMTPPQPNDQSVYSTDRKDDLLIDQLTMAAIAHNDLAREYGSASRGSLANHIDKYLEHPTAEKLKNHRLAGYIDLSNSLVEIGIAIRPTVKRHIDEVRNKLNSNVPVSNRQIQDLVKQIIITTDAKSAQSKKFNLEALTLAADNLTKDFNDYSRKAFNDQLTGVVAAWSDQIDGRTSTQELSQADWRSKDQRSTVDRIRVINPVKSLPYVNRVPFLNRGTSGLFDGARFVVTVPLSVVVRGLSKTAEILLQSLTEVVKDVRKNQPNARH